MRALAALTTNFHKFVSNGMSFAIPLQEAVKFHLDSKLKQLLQLLKSNGGATFYVVVINRGL